MIMSASGRTHPSSHRKHQKQRQTQAILPRAASATPHQFLRAMDTRDDTLERYSSSNLPSSSATDRSQGHSLSVWRIPPERVNSKPISSGHSKSPNLNQPQQRNPTPPPSLAASYPNVPNSKKNGWRVRNAFEEIPTIVTLLEGRLHLHPPPTLKIPNLITANLGNPQRRDSTWLRHDRAEPSSSSNLSTQLS